jgi:hypothetical protein
MSGGEQRNDVRYRLQTTGSNPIIVTAGVLPRAALVCDLSSRGLGLLATFAPPVGSVLPVWLPGQPGEVSSVILVHVIHVQPATDALHRIGAVCHDEPSAAALAEFLARLPLEPTS